MKYISVLAVVLVLLCASLPVRATVEFNEDVRKDVVGLFGTLLAPSIFTTASMDQLTASLYGRTLTAEGVVPDFDGDIEAKIDDMTIFASARLHGLGLTLGFGPGNDFEFSQPIIISADYKISLVNQQDSVVNAAVDVQYTIISLPNEENIRVSALGFGVVSLNGLISAKLLYLLEPYAGLTVNYVYLNSDAEGDITVWKPVPKLGLRLNILPILSATTEIMFIRNSHLDDSAWMWNIGASIRF